MGYEKTNWLKRILEFPDRYTIEDLGGGLFTIVPSSGTVSQGGTPLTEDILNHGETQYDKVIEDFDSWIQHFASASDVLRKSEDGEVSQTDTTYVKKVEITIPAGFQSSTFRIKFDLKLNVAGGTAYGRIYKNGIAHGTEQTETGQAYVTQSEDLVFAGEDTCELWLKSADAARYAFAENFRIYCDNAIVPATWA